MPATHQTVSLVLGSGGARGHAHIGVIKALQEAGLKVRYISGTSMGAVIGGVFAADKLESYTDWAFGLRKRDVVGLLDLSFSLKSIFKGERIINELREQLGDDQIEDLGKRFTAVATSLYEQREVWLNRGSLFTAIRASAAVPGFFSPVSLNGHLLVDGGLINPIPIAPTLNDSTDLTIAVNLAGVSSDGKKRREKEENIDAADLLVKSIDVMQGSIARLKLAAYAPDKTIEIPRDACSFFEFHRAEEMAELGYQRAQAALADLASSRSS
jgi:NTE family protein